MKRHIRLALAALALFFMSPIAAGAQVTPAAGTPQLSASVPAGAFNLFPYLATLAFQGNYKIAIYTVSCTPAAAATCAASATPMLPTTGAFATQFSAAPVCFTGMDNASVATLIAVKHSFNGAFTTDTPTLTASASVSTLLSADVFCIQT